MTDRLEHHPLKPWLPPNARLLMCGTFPPPKARWTMDFYYPNFINDMWRVMGIVFHGDKEYFVDLKSHSFRLDAIKKMLLDKSIALSDTGRVVNRLKGNASDKFLQILEPINLSATFAELPLCTAIATTGAKAAQTVAEATGSKVPATGEFAIIRIEGVKRPVQHWRMPSTSRAYPMSVESKAEYYRCMFCETGIL